MNLSSNQLHVIAAIAQGCNALVALLSAIGTIPHVPPQVSVAIVGFIAAVGHIAAGIVTPNTNAQTPDNAPPKPPA